MSRKYNNCKNNTSKPKVMILSGAGSKQEAFGDGGRLLAVSRSDGLVGVADPSISIVCWAEQGMDWAKATKISEWPAAINLD